MEFYGVNPLRLALSYVKKINILFGCIKILQKKRGEGIDVSTHKFQMIVLFCYNK